jgi:hypothetical protein
MGSGVHRHLFHLDRLVFRHLLARPGYELQGYQEEIKEEEMRDQSLGWR